MARGNFHACLDVTLGHEGGWSDHPKDPGGATMKGVTLATFRRYHPEATKDDLREITISDLRIIYRDGYWQPVQGNSLPFGIDLATFDFGVNSGPSRAARYLQRAVGATQDGKIGPKTLAAVAEMPGLTVIKKLCAARLSFKQGLRTWSVFGRGWGRRVAEIEAKAASMWMKSETKAKPEHRAEALRAEGEAARSTATKQERGAGGAVGGGGGIAGGDALATGDVGMVTIAVFAGLVVVGVVMLMKSRQNKERAVAYLREADE